MKKYLIYYTHEFERYKSKYHELIGVAHGENIEDAKSAIQGEVQTDMDENIKFHDCTILADDPLFLNTIHTSDKEAYDFRICGIAYPKYLSDKNFVEYYGIFEVDE